MTKKNTKKKKEEPGILKGVQKLEGFEKPCEPWVYTAGENNGSNCLSFGDWRIDIDQWATVATPHDLTPGMTEEEFEALRESIRLEGVLEPVFFNQHGNVLDGFHRLKGWWLEDMKKKIEPPRCEILKFPSKEAEIRFVLMKNLSRRHLSTTQRRQVAEGLLRNKHNGTDGYIGALCGLNCQTVKRIRKALEKTPKEEGGIEVLPVRTSKRGKKYKQVAEKSADEDQMAVNSEPSPGDDEALADENTASKPQDTSDANPSEVMGAAGEYSGKDEAPTCDHRTPEHGVFDSIESCLEASPQERLTAFLGELVSEWWARHGLRPVLTGNLYEIVQEMSGPACFALAGSESQRKKEFADLISDLDNERHGDHIVFVTKLGNSKVFNLSPPGWRK